METDIASRVRNLIEELGVSNRTFAKSIEITEDKLSKSLAGTRTFQTLELAAIAERAGRSVEWVLTGRLERELTSVARVNYHTDHADSESIGLQLAKTYAHSHDVLGHLGRARAIPPLPTVEESGRFVDEGQRMAGWASAYISGRDLLGPTSDLVVRIEEAFGVHVAATTSLPSDCAGLSFQDDDFRLMLLASSSNWTRRRFTMAHELGHLLWGDADSEVVADPSDLTRDGTYFEKRANSFAANFLMPEGLVRELAGASVTPDVFHSMVVQLKVSPSAMAARLYKLRLIDWSLASALRSLRAVDSAKLAGGMNDWIAEEAFASNDMPPLHMLSQFIQAYLEGETTAGHLSRLTNLTPDEWRDLLKPSIAAVSDVALDEDSDTARELPFVP